MERNFRLTEEEIFEQKRKEVIQKFSSTFYEKFKDYNPYLRKVVYSLINGENPYTLLEKLIEINTDLANQNSKLIQLGGCFEMHKISDATIVLNNPKSCENI